jgi:hypothetical protein
MDKLEVAMPRVATRIIETSEGSFSHREASEKYGINLSTLEARFRNGWLPDEICGIAPRRVPDLANGRNGFVYGWWCKNKSRYVYVGLTVQSIKARINNHVLSAKNGSNTPLHVAIRELGELNFEVRPLWSGPANEVQEKEKFYISLHKTLTEDGGYNVRVGGELGVHGGTSVYYNGEKYPSLMDAWVASGKNVPYETFVKRVRKGFSIEKALEKTSDPRIAPMIVDGRQYPSKRDAFRAEAVAGLGESAFNQRLRKGWTPEQALGLCAPPEKFRLQVNGKDFRTLKDACSYYGKSYKLVHGQVTTQGWTVEQALGIEIRDPRWERVSVVIGGINRVFPSKQAAWKELGANVKYTTFNSRVKNGWSVERALGFSDGGVSC